MTDKVIPTKYTHDTGFVLRLSDDKVFIDRNDPATGKREILDAFGVEDLLGQLIPPGLRHAVSQLVEFYAQQRRGNVVVTMKPGSKPIVKFEEVRVEIRCEDEQRAGGRR